MAVTLPDNFIFKAKFLFKYLIFSITLITLSQSTTLNVPKLLLPRSNRVHINFTLAAENGCYRWMTSRPEAVKIQPLSVSIPPTLLLPSACSQQAQVSTLSVFTPLETGRGNSIILAQDSVTGHTLRCDVIVDWIQQIQVVTTTHHLFTEDPPLELSITARDSEDNTFSSLAGLQFEWRLSKEPDTADIIRFVRFSVAGYTTPHHILSLEEAGQRGDKVLLEGLRSGVAHIRVWPSDPEYKWVEPATLTLLVTDRLYLSPSQDMYLLRGSTLPYRIWRTVHSTQTEVSLGAGGYELSVETNPDGGEEEVIRVDQQTATVTGVKLGLATVFLSHPSLPEDFTSQLPQCSVSVVEPSYLSLSIAEEDDRWVLDSGHQYQLTIRVHDQNGHVAHLSQNVVFAVEMSDVLFDILESSANHSYYVIKTRGTGHTTINATLSNLTVDNLNLPLIPPITVHQEVEIYEPLSLLPPVLVFPWQPMGQPYQYHVQAEGGSGSVSWSVSDSNVAIVTVQGDVMSGKKLGQAKFYAADTSNPLHIASGQVFVLMPGHLELLPQTADCRVGETITLPLAVWGLMEESAAGVSSIKVQDQRQLGAASVPQGQSPPPLGRHAHAKANLLEMTDCSLMKLRVTTNPPLVFTRLPGSVGCGSGYCGGLQMEAVGPGHTVVTVSIEAGRYNISAMATLAAHSPLRALVSKVVLSRHASWLVVFHGGPQAWPLAPGRFYSNIKQEGGAAGLGVEAISQSEPERNQQHVYRVTCLVLGQQSLVFSSGNSPGPLNQKPSVEESRVTVDCSNPASLSLSLLASPYPSPPSLQRQPCPQPQYPASLLAISSSRPAALQLAVFDHKGVQFDNFSSCSVVWSSSNASLLSLPVDRHESPGRQVLHTHDLTGTVTIEAVLAMAESLWAPSLSACIHLRLVEDRQWSIHSVTLYNHPDVVENVTLVHGSGHFLVRLQDRQLANVTYLESSHVIQLSPLRLGFSTLLAYDLCVTSPEPAVASLLVSDIKDFQIDFVDIVEVGHSALVRVRVLDSNGQPFLQRYLPLMQLNLTPSSSIVTVDYAGPLDKVSVGYRVSGLAIGVVSLHLSAVNSLGTVLTSSHKQLQVYPRFTLQPRSLALAMGSTRQVKWEGGPHPQSSVGFSVSDSRIATVTETGLVRGLAVGVVKLRGALQTVTQDTGALLTFARDVVEVEVFNLTGIRIQAPLVRLSVGTEMPVYVMGSDSSQNPLALGSVESGLLFHWSLGKLGVLNIKPRHNQAGVTVSAAHSFSMMVTAWASGMTSLRVTVQLANHTADSPQQLSDDIQILVFQEMQLAVGTSNSILMSPYSHYALQSNKDTICPVRYALCQCVKGEGLVTVDSQGVLRAGSGTGAALLEVIAMESCGINQTMLISVRVSPVWFVRLYSVSSLHSVGGVSQPAFPLGWTIRVRAQFYDNLGQQFQAHNTRTRIVTNRDDLVQVTPDSDSHSFVVQTVSGGLTVLGVQGDPTNPSLSDYTPLPVLPAISAPPHTLRPGDLLCFSTPLTGEHGQPGQWAVSSNQVLQIDQATGAALAKHSGTVVVYYRLEGGQQALREVRVDAPVIASLLPNEDRFLTNWADSPHYSVPVELYTDLANTAPCSLSQREAIEKKLRPEAELECVLHLSAPYQQLNLLQAVFKASPHYNHDIGIYSCRISVHPQEESIRLVLSTLPLTVSLSASLRGQSPLPLHPLSSLPLPHSGRPVQLPYMPAFHCPVSALTLSVTQPVAELSVMGTKDMMMSLGFHCDSPNVVLSEPSWSSQDTSLLLLSVHLAHTWDKPKVPGPPANITIYSRVTPQTQTVTVSFLEASEETRESGLGQRDSGPLIQLLDFNLILSFVVFAVLAITATLFIAYNSILSRVQTVPIVYMHSTPTNGSVNLNRIGPFSPWITASYPDPVRSQRRRQWLWSTR